MPKISIILPSYNGEKFIKESIDSIVKQSFKDWELILVNDCSRDNTLSIMQEYANKDIRIKVLNNEINKKLPESLNVGFRVATGEYLTWTSDDNIFKNNALDYMSNYLDNNKDCDLVSCNMDRINDDGKYKNTVSNKFRKYAYILALRSNVGACFMYRKSIQSKIGEYDTNLFCAEDYDYWCRIALNGNIHYSKKNLYLYRLNSQSLTATKKEFLREQANKVRKKYIYEFLNKYKMSRTFKAKCYLKLWKFENNKEFLYKSFIMNPFVILFQILKGNFI